MLPAHLSLPMVNQELAVALGMLLCRLEPSFFSVGPGVQQGSWGAERGVPRGAQGGCNHSQSLIFMAPMGR